MEEKKYEYIYVDSDIAKRFNAAKSEHEQLRALEKIISDRRIDIKFDLEALEDDVLVFKYACKKHVEEFEKVRKKQGEELDKIWEKFNPVNVAIDQHVKDLAGGLDACAEKIQKVCKRIDTLNNNLTSINISKIEQITDVLNNIVNLGEKEKDLVKTFLNSVTKE